jgi:hypothetical protein
MRPIVCGFVDKRRFRKFFSFFLIVQNAMYRVKKISKNIDNQYKYGSLFKEREVACSVVHLSSTKMKK